MAEQTCSNCGAENRASQKFCGECGTALMLVRANGHESRDPEEVRAMLTSYFDRSRTIIEQFGGEVVDRFIGDDHRRRRLPLARRVQGRPCPTGHGGGDGMTDRGHR
jgi:zinc-ribbon domain